MAAPNGNWDYWGWRFALVLAAGTVALAADATCEEGSADCVNGVSNGKGKYTGNNAANNAGSSPPPCQFYEECWPTTAELADFRHSIVSDGVSSVFFPSDSGSNFSEAITLNNRLYKDKVFPAVVVRPSGAQGAAAVQKAVRFAAAHRLRVSVSSGRHAYDGSTLLSASVHVDMREMNRVISMSNVTMRTELEMGIRFKDLYPHTKVHNVLFVGGSCPTVALGGFTQMGGTSVLSRLHGLSVDSAVSLRVVTATGELITASNHSHPDLFWALLGGGGGFGIVIDGVFRVHPAPPKVTSLSLSWAWKTNSHPDCGAEVLKHWRDIMRSIPREWGMYVVANGGPGYFTRGAHRDILGRDPVLKRIAELRESDAQLLRGYYRRILGYKLRKTMADFHAEQPTGVLSFAGMFAGPKDAAAAAIAPLLEFKPECQLRYFVEDKGELTGKDKPILVEHDSLHDYEVYSHPGDCSAGGGLGCNDRMTDAPLLPSNAMFNDDLINLMRRTAFATELEGAGEDAGVGFMWTQIDGAADIPNNYTAIPQAFRQSFGNGAMNVYWAHPEGDAGNISYHIDLSRQMYAVATKAGATPAGYVGYPDTVGMLDWKRGYFGEHYERLLRIKQKWDPANMFYGWQRVGDVLTPSGGTTA